LTGRENIYLNGAILGMPWADIRRQFDAIVSFAEVERFVDTPIKHYSSGMYMRLAFGVAAHLEPDILMVDEVLAVGDVAFQKKCLGRMGEVAHAGRTVLFVSHNMAQMRRLCSRIVWLKDGCVQADGNADDVVSAYLASATDAGMAVREYEDQDAPGDETVRVRGVRVHQTGGGTQAIFNMDEPVAVECRLDVLKPIDNLHVMFTVHSLDGILVFSSASWDHFGLEPPLAYPSGPLCYMARVPPHFLNRGLFAVSVNVQVPGVRRICNIDRAVTFEVSEIGGAGGPKSSGRGGLVRPKLAWTVERGE
jgi:lipopolysaccharide transport system ATP-binding protein